MATDAVDQFLEEVEELTTEPAETLDDALAKATEEFRGEDDPSARWIADGLGVSPDTLLRVVPGKEAGEDCEQVFYVVMAKGLSIASRADGLRTYAAGVLTEKVGVDDLHDTMAELHLAELGGAETLDETADALYEGLSEWVLLAEGIPPTPGTPEKIEYLDPSKPGKALETDELSLVSLELHEFLVSDVIDKEALKGLRAPAVVPGDSLANGLPEVRGTPGRDVFGRAIEPGLRTDKSRMEVGLHVSVSEEGHFRAERYGYMCLIEGRLSVLSPLWVSPDEMKVYLVILDERPQPVTVEMLQQCLADMGIVSGIDQDKLAERAAALQGGEHKKGMFLVAEGTAPVHGQDASVEILVDLERRAGKVLDDGSMDFRDVNFTPSVSASQLIARLTPARQGTDGTDVRANTLDATDGEEKALKAGDNVRTEREGAIELYFSTIDGAVRYEKDEIAAVELLVVKGDISFATGNLHFAGEVMVDGSVLQGFSVKAGGPVTITGTVEAAALVAAKGDVTVGKGILGRKTRVVSEGTAQAQFVQEASVLAKGDILLGNYAYHAQLQCGGKLVVSRGAGSNGGSIMGGQTWALGGVETHMIGNKAGSDTLVVSGVNQEQVRKLDKIGSGLEASTQHIAQILTRFGLSQIDMTQIKNMLAASTGPRRRILVRQAQQLGKLAQVYQSLLAEKSAVEVELNGAGAAEIKVSSTVYPGVLVRIGDHRRKIVEEIKAARFHVEDDKLLTN